MLPSLLRNCSDKALPLLKTALVAPLDKTTQLFLHTAIQRGIKIPSDTLPQSCKRSCACGQCLSPCYSSSLVDCFREERSPSSHCLLPSPHGQHNLPHPSILGRRRSIAGKGWRKGEPLQPAFSLLPGWKLFIALGLMGQGAQHRSEGQGWAPSAGNKATSVGTQKNS